VRDEVWQPGHDVLVLTEADSDGPPYVGFLDIPSIEAATGLRYLHAKPQHRWDTDSHGFLGAIVFVHPSFLVNAIHLLDLPGWCHRGAVVVDLSRGDDHFLLVATHLSLSQVLRLAQMRVIAQHIERAAPKPAVLVGDLNEWRPWGGLALSRRCLGVTLDGPAKATFPAARPVLPLDRVLCTPPAKVLSSTVLDGPGIRQTSDHRPLAATIQLNP
jgi:endonuclease/exonuclease/phosphatase family metal-dependent hydrolase